MYSVLNNYKPCNRKFIGGILGVPQADTDKHSTGQGHKGLLEDAKDIVIDRRNGNGT